MKPEELQARVSDLLDCAAAWVGEDDNIHAWEGDDARAVALMRAAPVMYAALAGCVDELELHEKAARTDGDADLLRRLAEARAALAAADKGAP